MGQGSQFLKQWPTTILLCSQCHQLIWINLTDILNNRVHYTTRSLHANRRCAFLFGIFFFLLIPPSLRMLAKRLCEQRKATDKYMLWERLCGKERMDTRAHKGWRVSWYKERNIVNLLILPRKSHYMRWSIYYNHRDERSLCKLTNQTLLRSSQNEPGSNLLSWGWWKWNDTRQTTKDTIINKTKQNWQSAFLFRFLSFALDGLAHLIACWNSNLEMRITTLYKELNHSYSFTFAIRIV